MERGGSGEERKWRGEGREGEWRREVSGKGREGEWRGERSLGVWL